MPDRNVIDRWCLPAFAVAMPFVAVALGSHLTDYTGWVGTFELVITGGLLACTVATAVATVGRIRWLGIGVAGLVLVANTAYIIARLAGVDVISFPAPDPKFAAILATGTLVGIAGLAMRRQWARWLCLALGAAGFGSGALNAINFWEVTGTVHPDLVWYGEACKYEWVYLVNAIGSALIIINLVATRGSFVATGAWSGSEPVMRALRLSMIASFAAVPMLLVYAWMQPIVPETKTTALVLAAALTLGGVLAVRGMLVGALLLVIAGLGLLAQTLATMLLADGAYLPTYYAVFWTPAAVLAIVSGALLAGPTLRLLRR